MSRRYKTKTKAAWVPDKTSPLHVTCSACNFRVETARAIETGWLLSEYIGLKYKYCPNCGRTMSLPSD